MTPRVVILSGDLHAGKTTALTRWIESRRAAGEQVAGILGPVVDGRRTLCSVATGECRTLELGRVAEREGRRDWNGAAGEDPDPNVVVVGPYRFDRGVFAWARREIDEAASRGDTAGGAAPVGAATSDAVALGGGAGGAAGPGAWIVVDEVGPLELRGGGLDAAVRAAVARTLGEAGGRGATRPREANPGAAVTAAPERAADWAGAGEADEACDGACAGMAGGEGPLPRLLLVVRESLVERVAAHYAIPPAAFQVVTTETLPGAAADTR